MEIALLLLAGLVLLVLGGEGLVRGASSLALRVGISKLVVGLTVVAFGTSAPELIVSLQAAFGGSPDIAIGNVVGSNIFNVLFILGFCALIMPLVISSQLVRREVPIMVAASLVLWAFASDMVLSKIEGFFLFISLVAYTYWTVQVSRKETKVVIKEANEEVEKPVSVGISLLYVLGGLFFLVIGARWFVDGAVQLAQSLGVSETVIGLTIIAAGTSMPEVATSIVATVRGNKDIAVGNVIGSNIFNILGILGLTAAVAPTTLPVALSFLDFDLAFMTAVAVACMPIFFSGRSISRLEGIIFLGYYVAYVVFLFYGATNPEMAQQLKAWKIAFAAPLTIAILLVLALKEPLPKDK